ncbi:MAG: MATE family efflux transporter [Acidobacteriota bacterium]
MATKDLTTGSVPKALAAMTGPMTLGVLAVISVGLADAYFVGRLGEAPLAAIGFVFPVTIALTSLGIGLSAGANATISQALGRRDEEAAQRIAAHVTVVTLVLGLVVMLLGWWSVGPLFRALGAEPELLSLIEEYMVVWYAGFPLLAGALVVNAAIRAHGNTALPAALMSLNAVFNVGLDPVLIWGWGPIEPQGVAGAAQATVIAFAVSLLVSLWPVLNRLEVTRPGAFLEPGYGQSLADVGAVGAPAALANAINPAGLAVLTAIVAQFGSAAVAGFGAAGRIESFAMVPLLGLSGSIGPVIGQNWGAKKIERAGRAVRVSSIFCVAYGLGVAVLLWFVAGPLAERFSPAPEVQAQTALYLRIVSWSFFGYGLVIVVNASLNARSQALQSMLLSLGRVALLLLPLAWLGAELSGLSAVYAAAAAANILAAVAALLLAKRSGLWA